MSNKTPRIQSEEKLIKIYNNGKVRYYMLSISIIVVTNIIQFYIYLKLFNLNLFHLLGFDYLYLALIIGSLIFINMNILFPVIGKWDDIERKYKEIKMGRTQNQ